VFTVQTFRTLGFSLSLCHLVLISILDSEWCVEWFFFTIMCFFLYIYLYHFYVCKQMVPILIIWYYISTYFKVYDYFIMQLGTLWVFTPAPMSWSTYPVLCRYSLRCECALNRGPPSDPHFRCTQHFFMTSHNDVIVRLEFLLYKLISSTLYTPATALFHY